SASASSAATGRGSCCFTAAFAGAGFPGTRACCFTFACAGTGSAPAALACSVEFGDFAGGSFSLLLFLLPLGKSSLIVLGCDAARGDFSAQVPIDTVETRRGWD